MVVRVKAKRTDSSKDKTKAELIAVIVGKTKKIPARFQPAVKRTFLVGLKYKTKPELKRIALRMKVEVDDTGYDIYTT